MPIYYYIPSQYLNLTATLLTINKQQIWSLLRQKSQFWFRICWDLKVPGTGRFVSPLINSTLFVFRWVEWSMRLCIFQGRDAGFQIDPWEDADYSIYRVTDRFGFLQ